MNNDIINQLYATRDPNEQQCRDVLSIFNKVRTYNKPTTHSLNSINYRAQKLNQCVDNEQRDNMLNEYRLDMNNAEFNLLKTTMIYMDQI